MCRWIFGFPSRSRLSNFSFAAPAILVLSPSMLIHFFPLIYGSYDFFRLLAKLFCIYAINKIPMVGHLFSLKETKLNVVLKTGWLLFVSTLQANIYLKTFHTR